MATLQAIDAKTLLRALLGRQGDAEFMFEDFFKIPLSEFSCKRVSIVYPEMDLAALVRRMYKERKDLLLVFEGTCFTGLVTAGDIFDAMIGAAVLDNALFNTDLPAKGSIVENARMCCLKQKISCLFDSKPVHHLNTENTILTAVRVLLTQSPSHVLLSNDSQNRHQLLTAESMLSALLLRLKSLPPKTPLNAEMMNRLEVLFDVSSPPLAPSDSVFKVAQAIHFNNLTCAAVMSDQQRPEGIITTNSLLKAFLDSIERAFKMR
jgi:CBS domain-containing protein